MTKVAQADIHIRGKDKTKTAFNSVQGRLMRLKKGLTGLHGAMGLVLGAGFVAMGKEALKSADSIGKFADRAGITTSELQKMRYAFDLAGVGVEAVDKAFLTFGKRLGKAHQGIGALAGGLKGGEEALLEKLKATNSTSEALDVMFRAMGNAETQTRKLAIADAAFGMAGLRMTAAFRDGSGAFFEAKEEAERLGIVLDEKLIRKAEALNDQMSKAAAVIKSKFTVAFMMLEPWLRKTADGFIDLMQSLTGVMNFSGFERNTLEVMLKSWEERLEDLNKQFALIPDNIAFSGWKSLAGWVHFNDEIKEARDIVNALRDALKKLPDAAMRLRKGSGGASGGGFNQLESTAFPRTKSATRIPLVGEPSPVYGPQNKSEEYQKMIDLGEHRVKTMLDEIAENEALNRIRERGNESLARTLELDRQAEKIKGRDLNIKEMEEIEKIVEAQAKHNKQLEIQNKLTKLAEAEKIKEKNIQLKLKELNFEKELIKERSEGDHQAARMMELRKQVGLELFDGREAEQKQLQEIMIEMEKYNRILEIQNRLVGMAEAVFDRWGDGMLTALQRGEDAFESFKNTALAALFDIGREMTKLMVFDPIKKAAAGPLSQLAGSIGSAIGGSWFGGSSGGGTDFNQQGFASGGFISAGKTALVGERGAELFRPTGGGTVIPNDQLGGGGVSVTLNLSTGVQSTVRAEVMGMMPMIASNVKNAVAEARQRGGAFSEAMGV